MKNLISLAAMLSGAVLVMTSCGENGAPAGAKVLTVDTYAHADGTSCPLTQANIETFTDRPAATSGTTPTTNAVATSTVMYDPATTGTAVITVACMSKDGATVLGKGKVTLNFPNLPTRINVNGPALSTPLNLTVVKAGNTPKVTSQ